MLNISPCQDVMEHTKVTIMFSKVSDFMPICTDKCIEIMRDNGSFLKGNNCTCMSQISLL